MELFEVVCKMLLFIVIMLNILVETVFHSWQQPELAKQLVFELRLAFPMVAGLSLAACSVATGKHLELFCDAVRSALLLVTTLGDCVLSFFWAPTVMVEHISCLFKVQSSSQFDGIAAICSTCSGSPPAMALESSSSDESQERKRRRLSLPSSVAELFGGAGTLLKSAT
eukprot:s3369_g3.t1